MLKTILGVIGCAAALLMPAVAPAQTLFRPVAIVNDSAITAYDVTQREQMMVALGAKAGKDELRSAALDRLIEDRLKAQEAKRGGLSVTQEEIDAGIEETAKNAGMAVDEFRTLMRENGVTDTAISDLVSSGLMWRDMVRSRFAARVEPGEAEIDAEIALLQQRTGTSYRVAEIGLPLTEPGRSEAQTLELAARLSESLNQGGDFAAAAAKYSRSPSAAAGGEVGWVPADRMPPAMADAVGSLAPGQVTPGIPVPGGISILKLLETKSDAASAIDPADQDLRDKIRRNLSSERTSRLAEGLLQELRRDALIEIR